MPQELALFDEFTIEEILIYYGIIYHMNRQEIDKRIANLREILNLPEKSRIISRLSGGQQRRVSIAITMIHRPRLIILDEPTVGVDSLLRHKIWQPNSDNNDSLYRGGPECGSGYNLIIGGELNNMPVALYNNDEQPQQLSRMFIDSIDGQRIKFNEYQDLESAVNSVRNGRLANTSSSVEHWYSDMSWLGADCFNIVPEFMNAT
ncbi:unnamed protein product [Oppiella nova]|uniref:ABC transporter domain-containing protein n=1 Tax=Oppiella nova TaxID=334625 RepID=A0A7R9LLR1_9ACAR|nr:unnamed protein product [Oppiella nova]CAG2164241.1 unnamed protein product [Oppiella nova]